MKLNKKSRKAIGDELYTLCLQRFDGIPTRDIGDILEAHELHIEDGIYCGADGRCSCPLLTPDEKELQDSELILSWHRSEVTGRYEITAYLS